MCAAHLPVELCEGRTLLLGESSSVRSAVAGG